MSPTGVVEREVLGVTRCESELESQVEGEKKKGKEQINRGPSIKMALN